MKKLLWMILFLPFTANAFEVLSVDTVGVTVQYTEPTTNVDGSTLDDLTRTEIYYDIQGDVDPAIKALDVIATNPAGGGTVSMQIPITVPPNTQVTIDFYAIAVDDAENPSPQSNMATIVIDRLPPAQPN